MNIKVINNAIILFLLSFFAIMTSSCGDSPVAKQKEDQAVKENLQPNEQNLPPDENEGKVKNPELPATAAYKVTITKEDLSWLIEYLEKEYLAKMSTQLSNVIDKILAKYDIKKTPSPAPSPAPPIPSPSPSPAPPIPSPSPLPAPPMPSPSPSPAPPMPSPSPSPAPPIPSPSPSPAPPMPSPSPSPAPPIPSPSPSPKPTPAPVPDNLVDEDKKNIRPLPKNPIEVANIKKEVEEDLWPNLKGTFVMIEDKDKEEITKLLQKSFLKEGAPKVADLIEELEDDEIGAAFRFFNKEIAQNEVLKTLYEHTKEKIEEDFSDNFWEDILTGESKEMRAFVKKYISKDKKKASVKLVFEELYKVTDPFVILDDDDDKTKIAWEYLSNLFAAKPELKVGNEDLEKLVNLKMSKFEKKRFDEALWEFVVDGMKYDMSQFHANQLIMLSNEIYKIFKDDDKSPFSLIYSFECDQNMSEEDCEQGKEKAWQDVNDAWDLLESKGINFLDRKKN